MAADTGISIIYKQRKTKPGIASLQSGYVQIITLKYKTRCHIPLYEKIKLIHNNCSSAHAWHNSQTYIVFTCLPDSRNCDCDRYQ